MRVNIEVVAGKESFDNFGLVYRSIILLESGGIGTVNAIDVPPEFYILIEVRTNCFTKTYSKRSSLLSLTIVSRPLVVI